MTINENLAQIYNKFIQGLVSRCNFVLFRFFHQENFLFKKVSYIYMHSDPKF